VHDRAEDPEPPEIAVDDREHETPVEFVVTVRETVPEKPLRGATAMVEAPPAPALTVTLVGPAEMTKSGDDDGDTET